MEIRKMPIDRLTPYNKNPRADLQPGDKEYEKLKASIDRWDLVEPLIWNERTGRLVGGHQRLKILRERGDTEVEVSIVDLSEEDEKALNIALNKIEGSWDEELLTDILMELELEDFDLGLTGFDDEELQELLDWEPDLDEAEEDNFDVDSEVEEIEEPVTQPGDLWKLGRHRLLCGDCTKADDVEALLAGAKVDALITDPPYGVNYSGKNEFLNRYDKGARVQKPIANDAIEDYRQFFSEFLALIPFAEYNTVYCFMSGQQLHSVRLAMDDCSIKWGDYLIWVKNNHVLGRKDYNAKHEFIVYGWKGKHKFYGESSSVTVLNYDKPLKSELHPTMKPISLVGRLIKDGAPRKGVIYEPFAGSGTTLMAAEQLGRTGYCMELDPVYCDVIVKRYEDLTGEKAERISP